MHFLLPYDQRDSCRPIRITQSECPFIMRHGKAIRTAGEFGSIISQVFKGRDYRLWQHHFQINNGIFLSAYTDRPIITINYMLQGSPLVLLDSMGKVRLTSGTAQLFYVPSVRQQIWFDPGDYNCIHIEYSTQCINRLAAFSGLGELVERALKKSSQIHLHSSGKISQQEKHILSEIINLDLDYGQAELYIQSKALELLLRFIRKYSEKISQVYSTATEIDKVRQIKDYIAENIYRNIKVADLARRFAINETSLYRQFRLQMGCSISSYIKCQKLEKAMLMLKETDLAVNQIAIELGYEFAENFTRAFRNFYGDSPASFREGKSEIDEIGQVK